jgi:Golgi nucleoside diphosphatase
MFYLYYLWRLAVSVGYNNNYSGSQGSRMHVYEFDARMLETKHDLKLAVQGVKLSVPSTDTAWTDRLLPGLDSFAYIQDPDDMKHQVAAYLNPLLRFAETVLQEKEKHFHHYPIYLKATGGLRSLPRPYRVRLMNAVRLLFQDETFNPFFFKLE